MSETTLFLMASAFPAGVIVGFFVQVVLAKHMIGAFAACASLVSALAIGTILRIVMNAGPLSLMPILTFFLMLAVCGFVFGAWSTTILTSDAKSQK